MKRTAVASEETSFGTVVPSDEASSAAEMANLFSGTIMPLVAGTIILGFLAHQFGRWAIANGFFMREKDTGVR